MTENTTAVLRFLEDKHDGAPLNDILDAMSGEKNGKLICLGLMLKANQIRRARTMAAGASIWKLGTLDEC